MSEKIMIENKRILMGGNEYRLSIIKTFEKSYEAHLSDTNSQFTAERKFNSFKEIESELFSWFREMNAHNDPESRVFEMIRQWNGVVML